MMRTLSTLLALALALPAFAQTEPERVVMKLDEFLRLYEATKDREKDPEKAPRDVSIASVEYDGKVIMEDDEPISAVFTAKMRLEILKAEGWVTVPLLPASVALSEATIGGKDASIVISGGWYTLVTDKRGSVDVNLSFATSVHTSEGSSGLSFQLAPSGATGVVLSVPAREDLDFTVANARLQEDRVVGDNRVVQATLPATGSLAITWQREIPDAAEEEPRVYAEVYTLVGLGDGLLQATSTIHHSILFAGVDELSVQLPEDMTLLDVTGTGVRDWALDDTGKLTVSLNFAAEGAYPLTLEMEKVIGEGDVTAEAPIPIPLAVERSKGWIGVEARGNLEIGAGAVTGAAPIDVRSLPGAILGITGQPVLMGYKYLGTAAKVPLVVTQHEDVDVLVTLLDQTRATTMWTVDGRRLTSVKYQVRNNRKQYLRLSLPDGGELWSASVGGRAVQPAKSGDGRVLVPLIRSETSGGALAAFEVEVVYVEDGAAPSDTGRGSFRAQLPGADVPSTYVAWTVYSPMDAKIPERSVDGSLRMVEYHSNPIPPTDVHFIQAATPGMAQSAAGQAANRGSMGEGAVPVPVSLPVEGMPMFFEKLLALEEDLWVSYDFKGLK